MPELIADPDAVTPAWLTEVLRHSGAISGDDEVASFTAESIGTGQVGANVRFTLTYGSGSGPATVVGKFSSRDPVSQAGGVATLTYETEVAFYRELAPTVSISRPHCHFADIEHGTANVVLLMEDLAPAVQGDQIAGCTLEDATVAIDEAARLHGPRWGDPSLADLAWLNRSGQSGGLAAMLPTMWGSFVDRYRATLDDVTIETGDRLPQLLGGLASYQPASLTVIHYDYRLDNMLFGKSPDRPLVVVDWQTVQLGLGASDVAYFLGNAFEPEVRRGCEEALVQRYHTALVEEHGVTGYSLEQCWDDYRRSSYASLLMAVFASMVVGQTERGDRMFMAMANRSAQMGADLDAPGILSAP